MGISLSIPKFAKMDMGELGLSIKEGALEQLQGPLQVMDIFAFHNIRTKCSCLVNSILIMNDLYFL